VQAKIQKFASTLFLQPELDNVNTDGVPFHRFIVFLLGDKNQRENKRK